MIAELPSEFREKEYRVRRFQNWITIGFLYSLFYMTRYNFSANAPTLQAIFGWTKSDLGIFETLLPLVYGLAVVVNGPIADKIGGKKSFLIGAVGVVIMNLLFGAAGYLVLSPAVFSGKEVVKDAALSFGFTKSSLLWAMAITWAVNGYFQAFGALSIVKINAQWFHIRERGTFAAIFGVLIRFGLILSFSLTPIIAAKLTWQWAFWIPAILVTLFFFLTLFLVKDTPQKAGFQNLDTGDGFVDPNEKVSLSEVLKKVFASKVMWMIGIGSMMIGFVRRSVVDAWYPVYFKDVYNVTGLDSAYQIASWGIAVLGIAGGFVFGIMSDKIYKGRRAPVIAYGFIGMVIILLLFALSDVLGLGPFMAAVMIMLLSFFVNGAHGMIGGAVSMDFGGRKAAATAAGLIDGFQYLAGAFVGQAVGYITTNYGWQAWKLWPIPFAIIGAIIMMLLWNVMPKNKTGH
jgi:OPA family glycerol-3-phosphate transporter-like MFS transporter